MSGRPVKRMASRTGVLPLVALALLGPAACGGDDKPQADTPRGAPTADEPLKALAKRYENATATRTCADLGGLVHSQARTTPAEGALSPTECRDVRNGLGRLGRVHVVGEAQYGTGALLDEIVDNKTETGVFVVDVDRRWKFVASLPAVVQIETAPKDRATLDHSAGEVVEAIRRRDCVALFARVSASAEIYQASRGSRKAVCRRFIGPPDDRSQLTGQLRADPTAAPTFMGATRDFAFYGIANRSGRFDTLVMVTQPGNVSQEALRGKSRWGMLTVLTAKPPR